MVVLPPEVVLGTQQGTKRLHQLRDVVHERCQLVDESEEAAQFGDVRWSRERGERLSQLWVGPVSVGRQDEPGELHRTLSQLELVQVEGDSSCLAP